MYWTTSHQIRLRAVEPGDAETFFRWNQDSERARLLDFTWPPTSLESLRTWATEQSRRRMEKDAYHWVIETLDGVPVGTISTHNCSHRNGTFSYGVDVAQDHRGKGYACEAIRLILDYYFHELRYHKCNVDVHADNPASIRLHEKLGFKHEGTLRESQFTQGRYVDVLLFGITCDEYEQSLNKS